MMLHDTVCFVPVGVQDGCHCVALFLHVLVRVDVCRCTSHLPNDDRNQRHQPRGHEILLCRWIRSVAVESLIVVSFSKILKDYHQ